MEVVLVMVAEVVMVVVQATEAQVVDMVEVEAMIVITKEETMEVRILNTSYNFNKRKTEKI